MTAAVSESETNAVFRHEALFYEGDAGFVAGTLPFIREGIAKGEPVLVAVNLAKIEALRYALGADVDAVQFVDMGMLGRNPARIIGAWHEFVAERLGESRSVRGIGEPVCAGDNPAHLVECQIHESLLNQAFSGAPAWRLLCPYDVAALEQEVIDEAYRSHPYVIEQRRGQESVTSSAGFSPQARLDAPLPEPARHSGDIVFAPGQLHRIRWTVADFAQRFGMDPDRTEALIVATNEVVINSLRHGGGSGIFRIWRDGDFIVCEVRDRGHFEDPLVGRRPPQGSDGRGLWLVNRLCDLVQIRSYPTGSVVRLHMALAGEAELRLTQLTLHDQLTGVGNRAMLRNRLEHALDVGTRDHRRHALLFCDLDDFKAVNDTFGHRIGDEVLIAVAGRLRDGARPGDTIARLGGDEFVVLCEGVATDADAQLIADRVARALDAPVRTSISALPMSMSIGLALSRPGQTAEDLIAEADAAMYAAKRGRTSHANGS